MDLATLIGGVTAFGLVFGSIAMGGGMAFLDAASAMIVLGGTFGAMLLATSLDKFKSIMSVTGKAFKQPNYDLGTSAASMVEYAQIARREGILGLEKAISSADPFLANGLQMSIDGYPPEAIEEILETDLDYLKKRHKEGSDLLMIGGTFAPALGLIGTLIGLVQMLQNMSDPSTIGPAMAIALLTTFYGALLANLLFTPLATKLKMRSEEELKSRELMIYGVLCIANCDSPRLVEKKVNAILDPSDRLSMFE
mgnify:CR=1 FL=1